MSARAAAPTARSAKIGISSKIEIYFDYRSPYAYFLWGDASGFVERTGALLDWRPVSIDVLLNLQAGRSPWAPYEDPLSPIKRQYLYLDVARGAAYS